MTNLCEIKSVSFYRNATNFAVYIVARNIGTKDQFSAKIYLEQLPCCLFDQYLSFNLGDQIGTQKITERVGKSLKTIDIPRYELLDLSNCQKDQTYYNTKCVSSMEE